MTAPVKATILAVLLVAAGCRTSRDDPAPAEPTVFGPRAEPDEACGVAGDQAVPDPPPRTRFDPGVQATVTAVGADLVAAPAVAIDELVARPEGYVGKPVRVEGEVTAMCVHRRAWFAVRAGAANLRVLTAPAFLVPLGSTGKRARTVGTVALVEVPEEAARHYSRDHRLRDPSNPETAHRAVVLRATGAEFY